MTIVLNIMQILIFAAFLLYYRTIDKLKIYNGRMTLVIIIMLIGAFRLKWYEQTILVLLAFNAYCDTIDQTVYVIPLMLQIIFSIIVCIAIGNMSVWLFVVGAVFVLAHFIKAYALADAIMLMSCVAIGGHDASSYIDIGAAMFIVSAIVFIIVSYVKKIKWHIKNEGPKKLDYTIGILVAYSIIYMI